MSLVGKYTLGGVLFGLSFPVLAVIIVLHHSHEGFELATIISLHDSEKLLYIIDVAPLVLGVAGMLIGIQHRKLQEMNAGLEDLVKDKTAELINAVKKAEEDSRAKSNFLSTMSHEIRTPLNAVLGMNELLLKSDLNQEQYSYAFNVKTAGDSLLTIINDILDYTKIESGKMPIRPYDLPVHETTQAVINVLKSKAESKGLYLDIHYEANVPEVASVDGKRLNQILYNLVGNAIKFTKEGSVNVRCFCIESLGGTQLHFEVKDTGIGIDENQLEAIFEKFNQGRESTNKEFGGTGLGLSIARELARNMGGDCFVTSKKGVGSTFSFFVKIEKRESSKEEFHEKSIALNVDELPDLNILVAEDNVLNQQLIKVVLSQMGYNPIIANNGLEALEILKKQDFDLLLLDMRMPKMDGLQTVINIRSVLRNEQLIVVALTANAFEDDRQACLNAGMNYFLTKPLKQNELISTIQNFFPNGKPQ